MPTSSDSSSGALLKRQALTSIVRQLTLPLAPDATTGWKPYPIFAGPTRNMKEVKCHVSVLSPGQTPHEPHHHDDEELLMVLGGRGTLLLVTNSDTGEIREEVMTRGSVIYYPSNQGHTITNRGEDPLTYLMIRWCADEPTVLPDVCAMATHSFDEALASLPTDTTKPVSSKGLFHAPTDYLNAVHAHVTRVSPGGGYDAHADAHDVFIYVLSGEVETVNQTAKKDGVIFYAAGTEHGMHNPGETPAEYLVFEFHGAVETDLSTTLSEWAHRRVARPIQRRLSRLFSR